MIASQNSSASADAKAEPMRETAEAEVFHAEAIRVLTESGVPFLLAGTYAFSAFTGISRVTKDLDVFCKAGDYPRILSRLMDLGYEVEIIDDRWLAKVFRGRYFFDVIFASPNGTMPVGDAWFDHAQTMEILGYVIGVPSPTELIWSKSFVQVRDRYDGADVAHLILKTSEQVDWQRLLGYMEMYWEVLLIHLLNFRWIYPSERHKVPDWLLDELLDRLSNQRKLPPPKMKVCRGRMFSHPDYEIDVKQWGFADVGGAGEPRRARHDGRKST